MHSIDTEARLSEGNRRGLALDFDKAGFGGESGGYCFGRLHLSLCVSRET